MRRLIQNTTALAAALAMIAPQVGWAEMRISSAQAKEAGPVRAEQQPALHRVLQQELNAGLSEDELQCANGAGRPCADDVFLVTPKGVTVQLAQNGQMILAPKREQRNKAAGGGKVVPADRAAAAEAAGVEAAAAAAAGKEAGKEKPKKAQPKRQSAAEAAAAAAAAAATAEPEKKPTDALTEAMKNVRRDAPKAPAAKPESKPIIGDLEAALRDPEGWEKRQAAERDAAERRAEQAAAAKAEKRDKDAFQAAIAAEKAADAKAERKAEQAERKAEQAARRAEQQAERVAREERRKARRTAEQAARAAAAKEREAARAAQRPARTPAASAEAAAAAAAAAATAVPEVGRRETEAARQAAAEAKAPAVAALEEAAEAVARREMVRETVTEENSRSSDEDFETSLREALATAGGQRQPARSDRASNDDDDDDNDLAKALLLGLGAVAVGQVLKNNREVALSTPDRVVVERPDGSQEVIKDEVALLRQPGSTVTTENFDDGSSRTIVTRPDGSKVVTIRDADLRVLRRTLISADGTSTQLIDDTSTVEPVDVSTLPPAARPVPVDGSAGMTEDQLRAALAAEAEVNRGFTLSQVRNIPEVRALVAPVDINAITFDTGSAAILPNQAQQLATLGRVIADAIAENPREIFMIEGHTDSVGTSASNLALSDRRAESVALALSEYFEVPPENMVVQGYGEQYLKVRQEGDVRANRRASVRRITDLLQTAANSN